MNSKSVLVTCYLCGEQISSSFILSHQSKCTKKYSEKNGFLPEGQRLRLPSAPKMMIPNSAGDELDIYNNLAAQSAAELKKVSVLCKEKPIKNSLILRQSSIKDTPKPQISPVGLKKAPSFSQRKSEASEGKPANIKNRDSNPRNFLAKKLSDLSAAKNSNDSPQHETSETNQLQSSSTIPPILENSEFVDTHLPSMQRAIQFFEDLDPDLSVHMSVDEAVTKLEQLDLEGWHLICDALTEDNTSKTRLSALKAFKSQTIASNRLENNISQFSPPVTIILQLVTKNFKTTDLSILEIAFDFLTELVDLSEPESPFDRRAATVVIYTSVMRLADHRLQSSLRRLFNSLGNSLGPGFVFEHFMRAIKRASQKMNIAVIVEGLLVLKNIIEEFGPPNALDNNDVAISLTSYVETEMPKVRVVAVDILGLLYHYWGYSFRNLVLNNASKSSSKVIIEAKFEKIPVCGGNELDIKNEKLNTPDKDLTDKESNDKKSEPNHEDKSLVFTYSLQYLIDEDLEGKINSDDWSTRKDALNRVSNGCKKSGGFEISSDNASHMLLNLLADRVENDSEQSLRSLAVLAIGELVMRLKPDFVCDHLQNGLAHTLLNAFIDGKQSLRNQTRRALERCSVRNNAMNHLIQPISEKIVGSSPHRIDLMQWMTLHLPDVTVGLECLISPLIIAIQDQSEEIRKVAIENISFLLSHGLINRVQVLLQIRKQPTKVADSLGKLLNLVLIEAASDDFRIKQNRVGSHATQFFSSSTIYNTTTRQTSHVTSAFFTNMESSDDEPTGHDALKDILAQVHSAYNKVKAEQYSDRRGK